MNFLLVAINAKYIHSNPGLYSLRAYAGDRYEEHIDLAEFTINHSLHGILTGIYEKKPDVIGISCYIWNITMVEALLPELAKVLPGIPIWLGGPEVSYRGRQILEQFPTVFGVMRGEGEETFVELMRHYVDNDLALSQIKGIIFRGKAGQGELVENPERELISLDKLPFLYKHLEPFTNRIIYYETSRGCPYRCSYCLSSIDKTVRFRDMALVKRELQFFLDHEIPQVKFVDRTFNCQKKHAMEIWAYLIAHDNGITNFHFEIEGDILSQEELSLLKQARPGLFQMEIGVQSANPKTLQEIQRTAKLEGIREAVESLKQGENIHIHLDLIAGLPYETYESFASSFEEVYAMEPENLQLGFLKVLHGSPMEAKAEEYGLQYLSKAPYEVLSTKWLTYDEVIRLKRIEEMVELYYNSNQFCATLSFLEEFFETAFSMYEVLADFYDKKGYFVASPSRVYRYQVLLDFIEETLGEKESCSKEILAYFREALTYDIYLRENMKSRPSFAPDWQRDKEWRTGFYQEEAKQHAYLPTYAGYDAKQLQRMTHLEVFSYPVQVKRAKDGEKRVLPCKEKTAILFAYEERNPLTNEAKQVVVNQGGSLSN